MLVVVVVVIFCISISNMYQCTAVELKESKSNEISVLRHSFIVADVRKLSMMEVDYRRTRPK